MTNKILTGENWQSRIRDKMGVDIEYLPDETIEQPDCIAIAEKKVISRIPNYQSVSADNKILLEYAVVLQCCILLCVGMPARLPKKQSGPHESHELETEWMKRKADFVDEFNDIIGTLIDGEFPELNATLRPIFTTSKPKRPWESRY